MATNVIIEATNSVAAAAADAAATPAQAGPLALTDKVLNYLENHLDALAGCILILVAGFFVSRWMARLIARTLERKAIEPPVRLLIVRAAHVLIFGLFLLVALETLGFHLTALIAGISVAGVGIGFAMQGLLGNIIAGLAIIFIKPYRVGEYIEMLGVEGQVVKIELVTTTLLHGDNSRVIIPNRKIIGEVVHNYGTTRQLDLSVGVAHDTNLERAIQLIKDVLRNNPRVLREPTPGVAVSAVGDSSITIAIKPWTSLADMGPAATELYLTIIERFRVNKIEVASPHRDIRIVSGALPGAPGQRPAHAFGAHSA